MASIITPIFICVVLPVSIVLIIYLANINSDNKRAKVLIKAIESDKIIDIDKLIDAIGKKPQKTAMSLLHLRLLRGCIFSLIGLCFLVIALITWKIEIQEFFHDLMGILIFGSGLLSVGISYLIVYFATRKQVTDSSK